MDAVAEPWTSGGAKIHTFAMQAVCRSRFGAETGLGSLYAFCPRRKQTGPMKLIKFLLPLAIAASASNSATLCGQTLTLLHTFTASAYSGSLGVYTNLEGANPIAGLVLSGKTLCGTTYDRGTNGRGTVFSVSTNGAGFKVLHTFTASKFNPWLGLQTNADGINPYAVLAASGNTLYGTASAGGTNGNGTVFTVKTNGTGFTVLHTFTALNSGSNVDGINPYGGLVLAGNTLYGVANGGGTHQYGTLFSVNTAGTGVTVLHTFTGGSDGSLPRGSLVLSGKTLYGTAINGGDNGSGTVFSINTNGTGFTILHAFDTLNFQTNQDGANPYAGLVLSGSMLYGTAYYGGTNGSGTVFSVNTNGTGFKVLHTFAPLNSRTNLDGANPYAGLVLSGGTLHGTACYGGCDGNGTAFSVNTNGSGFTVLHAFTGTDGSIPQAGFALSGRMLYGTAYQGGTNGYGTVFSFPILPRIAGFSLTGTNLVINAINGVSGETCRVLMSTNVALPFSLWTPVKTNVLSATGNFTITATNAVSPAASKRFYILKLQ